MCWPHKIRQGEHLFSICSVAPFLASATSASLFSSAFLIAAWSCFTSRPLTSLSSIIYKGTGQVCGPGNDFGGLCLHLADTSNTHTQHKRTQVGWTGWCTHFVLHLLEYICKLKKKSGAHTLPCFFSISVMALIALSTSAANCSRSLNSSSTRSFSASTSFSSPYWSRCCAWQSSKIQI